jgi:hypothetical protein
MRKRRGSMCVCFAISLIAGLCPQAAFADESPSRTEPAVRESDAVAETQTSPSRTEPAVRESEAVAETQTSATRAWLELQRSRRSAAPVRYMPSDAALRVYLQYLATFEPEGQTFLLDDLPAPQGR